jgi:ABC-type multidrug transport system permease subunit
MIKLNDNPGHQYIFLLTLIFFNLVVSGLCMLVGVLTSSNSSANAAGSLVMLTSILFCG